MTGDDLGVFACVAEAKCGSRGVGVDK